MMVIREAEEFLLSPLLQKYKELHQRMEVRAEPNPMGKKTVGSKILGSKILCSYPKFVGFFFFFFCYYIL